ncbi:HNH endonuclease [Chryseobacterium sp. SIMBA_028]|uniref:HNH endonuclease n=1 Tax=Chryseobacterium sp. SIMBA_028 TaxID=3085771 RepID=UPI00397D96E0
MCKSPDITLQAYRAWCELLLKLLKNEDMDIVTKGFRFYYDKDLNYLYKEEQQFLHNYSALRTAKRRLRMYANLFNRDIRKLLINDNSICAKCSSSQSLQIDHIIPVGKGGRNELSNTQILCSKCNLYKSNNP